jgi:hypothetical protein
VTRLGDVNTRDIADAIRLGCRTMQSVFGEEWRNGVERDSAPA